MLHTLALVLALQVLLPPGAAEHFADGITVTGKLFFPYGVRPHFLDITLEDVNGNAVTSPIKSGPNNEFIFKRIALGDYTIVIQEPGLDIVRQLLVLTPDNFTGARVFVALHDAPKNKNAPTPEDVVDVSDLRKEPPKEAVKAFERAMDASRKDDLAQSIAELEQAVKLAPDYYEANLELGLHYQKKGQLPEARRLLGHALEINPSSMGANSALGYIYFDANEFPLAAPRLSAAVRLGNTSTDVYYMLGYSYQKIGELDLAEASLLRALAINPTIGKAHLALYNVYGKRGDLPKALGELDIYLEKYPDAKDHAEVQAIADKLRKRLKP